MLYEVSEGYERFDVCESCWTTQYSEGANSRKGFVSYWQGIYQAPPVAEDPIQKQTAETLLARLTGMNNPAYAAACYILAVMLERKR